MQGSLVFIMIYEEIGGKWSLVFIMIYEEIGGKWFFSIHNDL